MANNRVWLVDGRAWWLAGCKKQVAIAARVDIGKIAPVPDEELDTLLVGSIDLRITLRGAAGQIPESEIPFLLAVRR